MEPVTHVLTGACLARAGLNRRAAYTTAVMAVAAEFPDIDTLWSLKGPVSGFAHHRGITHTFLGIPVEAALLVLCAMLFHRWREHGRKVPGTAKHTRIETAAAPVNWGALYGFAVLALLSHILLDYTNNYGVRPFFPFNPHWYAASIVFIFDPLLFLLLLAGLLLPLLFGLVGQEVAGRREPFRGRGLARAALTAVAILWTFRAYEHSRALSLATEESLRAPEVAASTAPLNAAAADPTTPAPAPNRSLLFAQRTLAGPDPLNPFRWYLATDFGPAYQLATADTRLNTVAPGQILNKVMPDRSIAAAEGSYLGHVYLDWSPMPWITATASGAAETQVPGSGSTAVSFQDVRFMGSQWFLQRRETPPLTGTVFVDGNGEVLDQGLDGRFGR